ncbi:MAG: DUF1269 domain-containing protein [Gammaproteobacteria bacterium]
MRRIFAMVPDARDCRSVLNQLFALGIDKSHVHVVSHQPQKCTELPSANLIHTSDVAHGVEWGLGVGGLAGALGGLLAATFPPAGMAVGVGAVMATTAAGAGFGAVVTGLISKDEPNHEIEAYEDGLMRGELLMLIDVRAREAAEIADRLRERLPGLRVDLQGGQPDRTDRAA